MVYKPNVYKLCPIIKDFLVKQKWVLLLAHEILDNLIILIYNLYNGGLVCVCLWRNMQVLYWVYIYL